MTIALVDVYYEGPSARAACVLAPSWEANSALESHVLRLTRVKPYEPGSFYRRELPCLLGVLGALGARPDIVVIDGYVWLPSPVRPGLGACLYEALGRNIAVVGIAKTAFSGAENSPVVAAVRRGVSRKPLYVTAVGLELEVAAECVRRMAGSHRIPELSREVDKLSRGEAVG